jgi:hypothetical protein
MNKWQFMMLVAVALVAGLFCGSVMGQDKPRSNGVVINNGFMTAGNFLELSEPSRYAYAAGYVNGLLVAPMFGAQKEKMSWLEKGLRGTTNHQIAAIISKYIKEHPEEWHHQLHITCYRILLMVFNPPQAKQ